MRILHLMTCRGWSSDAYWAALVARELHARGHAVTFVARADTEVKVLRRLRELGVVGVTTLGFRGRRAPFATAWDLRALHRLLREHDIVHVHRSREHWMAALVGAVTTARPPLVRTRHIVGPIAAHRLNRWLYGPSVTAHVITVSDAIRARYLGTRLVEPTRVTALPGGVDAARFHPDVAGGAFRRRHGLAPMSAVVGVLASLRGMKGHATFLEAARRLEARHPAVRFVIAGEGRHGVRVRRAVADLGLGTSVVMTGFVDCPEEAVAAFDVAVYASDSSEGMGRVLFEYMAAGRPIAATAVGLAPEVLVDGDTARLVPPRDPERLARAIAMLLEERAFAERAARACRRLVEERYSAQCLAAEVERVYATPLGAGAAWGRS
ncbi:MAG: glycosyltransferase family 4 protein [Candidatus Rokuibacteriota bacterium]